MEKYSIEINTSLGWITYHIIMRPGEERARNVLLELQQTYSTSEFRIVKWIGNPVI